MKNQEIYYRNNKNKTELIQNYKVFFATNLISIFPLCLIQNFWFYLNRLFRETEEQQILLVLLSVLSSFLLINLCMTFRISLFSFIKMRADIYSLLLVLGITKKNFWKLIFREYCFSTLLLGIIGTFGSQGLSLFIIQCILKDTISFSLKEQILTFFIFSAFIILLFFVAILFTICIIIYKERKKDVIILFEKVTQSDARLYQYPAIYALKPIVGIIFIFSSLLLLINYSVGKMLVAMFVHSIGVLFIIDTDGYFISKFVKRFRHVYYENIIKWNNLFYQYKVNVRVIFIIYVLNFLLTFIIGGLIVSGGSDNNYEKYPYDVVVYGNGLNKNVDDSYRCMAVEIVPVGNVTAISNYDYNIIAKSNNKLNKGEIFYYEQKVVENFSPLENKAVLNIRNGENALQYKVLEADWKILFGEKIFPELNAIVVMNDEDFITFEEKNERKIIIATNNRYLIKEIKANEYSTENKVWYKSVQLEKDKKSNNIIQIIIYIIGLAFILESQSLVMIRQILDEKKERYQYEILKQLGMNKKELKIIKIDKIKNVLFFPVIFAMFVGILFFLCDYLYQTQMFIEWRLLLRYSCVLISFGLIQYIGYRVNICIINNYYERK